MKVSVPSRGLSYLNEIQRNEKIQFISFRPLTGTLLSKQEDPYYFSEEDISFRPLTGTLLSKH